MRNRLVLASGALLVVLAAACQHAQDTGTTSAGDSSPKLPAAASSAPQHQPAPPASEQPPAEPVVSATAAASASAAPAVPEELPAVKVANIGMHIGGGPNDQETKAPIRDSVRPHFDAFRRCWQHAEDASKVVDFGVDLLIDRQGGKAKVSAPRTAVQSVEFSACMVEAFEAIDFKRPRGGTTTVSYSLRFTPVKGN